MPRMPPYFGGFGGVGDAGPIGATGANAISWTWRGIWTGGFYNTGQTVYLSGQSYICILPVTSTGITNTTYWNKITSTGNQGLQGNEGIQGPSGSIGSSGSVGPSGTQGPSGSQGSSGLIGLSGIAGPTGLQGPTGIQGPSGLVGPASSSGLFSNINDVGITGRFDNTIVVYDPSLNRWVPKFTSFPIWDVRDFGASGDGIRNDFTGIRSAVVAANASGGTIYIPKGFYKVFLDSSNSGIIEQSGLLSFRRNNIHIRADNDAHIQVIATFASSGQNGPEESFPLFMPLAGNCRVVGGTYSFNTSGVGILFTGDGYNGFPIYFSNTAGFPFNTSFENCTFSGFKGESINGGLTNTFGEQLENTYWKNCTFMAWGAAWHDMLIYHQGRTTFDGCTFIQRATWNETPSEHSHTIYTGANRPYSFYKNCVQRNVGGGQGNRAYPFHFFGSVVTFPSYGLIIDGCTLANCSNNIKYADTHDHSIVCNVSATWSQTGIQAVLEVSDTQNLIAYNSNIGMNFGAIANRNILFNNIYDTNFANANGAGNRNLLLSNCSFRSTLLRNGREFSGGVRNSNPGIALYGGLNVLFANNFIQGGNEIWAIIIRNTFDLNGYTFVDNFFDSNGAAVVNRVDFTTTPSRNGNFIGNQIHENGATSPNFFAVAFGTGIIFHSNLFNWRGATATGNNAMMSISSPVSGCMIKNNTFMNSRRPPTINNLSTFSIGNYFFKTGNVQNYPGTGILSADIYNTSGNF